MRKQRIAESGVSVYVVALESWKWWEERNNTSEDRLLEGAFVLFSLQSAIDVPMMSISIACVRTHLSAIFSRLCRSALIFISSRWNNVAKALCTHAVALIRDKFLHLANHFNISSKSSIQLCDCLRIRREFSPSTRTHIDIHLWSGCGIYCTLMFRWTGLRR